MAPEPEFSSGVKHLKFLLICGSGERQSSENTIVGKYERDEVKPIIDVVKKLVDVLETTVGYLLGETEDRELLKDPSIMKRLNDIAKVPEQDKACVGSPSLVQVKSRIILCFRKG